MNQSGSKQVRQSVLQAASKSACECMGKGIIHWIHRCGAFPTNIGSLFAPPPNALFAHESAPFVRGNELFVVRNMIEPICGERGSDCNGTPLFYVLIHARHARLTRIRRIFTCALHDIRTVNAKDYHCNCGPETDTIYCAHKQLTSNSSVSYFTARQTNNDNKKKGQTPGNGYSVQPTS